MTAFFATEPWWYWPLFAVVVFVLAWVGRDIRRVIRRSTRYLRLNEEQRDRLIEDLLWQAHRQAEFELALRLRSDRLRQEPIHDLLRADVIA